MDCEIIRDLFSEYIENQLDEENLKLFEKHMEECQECRNEFYKFEKMLIRIKAIKDIEPPKELKNKIMNKVISEENKKLNAKIINFRKYLSIASVFIIFVCGFIYYQNVLIKNPSVNEETDYEDNLKTRVANTEEQGVSAFNSSEGELENSFDETENNSTNEEIKMKRSVPSNETETGINLYNEGIDISIFTNDINKFKQFLYENIENSKFYEENPNYIEVVLDKVGFFAIEEKIKNIEEYNIFIENLEQVKENIKQIIDDGYITDEGLIKFKINITEN